MIEINRLRIRLKNVQRNVTEYRMTVTEAKALLQEIDDLIEKIKIAKSIQEKPPKQVVLNEPTVTTTRILDGGTF